MTEKAWKQEERKVARALGGERTPLSGSNSRHTAGDAIQTPHFVDCKLAGQSNSTGEKYYTLKVGVLADIIEGAHQEEKDLGLLTVRFKHCSDRYVFLPMRFWEALMERNSVDPPETNTLKGGGDKHQRIYRTSLQDLRHWWEGYPGEDPAYLQQQYLNSEGPDTAIITWESFLYLDGRLKVCPECMEWQAIDNGQPHECPDCDAFLEGINHA